MARELIALTRATVWRHATGNETRRSRVHLDADRTVWECISVTLANGNVVTHGPRVIGRNVDPALSLDAWAEVFEVQGYTREDDR